MADARGYTRLPTTEDSAGLFRRQQQQQSRERWQEEEEDLRFRYEINDRVPWKSILLAIALLLSGTIFFIIAYLMLTSHIGGEGSQALGFIVLGFLVFLPGFYETRIAYYSWRGCRGYSFSRIPAY